MSTKDVEKGGNSRTLLVGMQIVAATVEKSMAVSQKLKYKLPFDLEIPPEYTSKKTENTNLKKYMHPNVHSGIIYNCQDMEA